MGTHTRSPAESYFYLSVALLGALGWLLVTVMGSAAGFGKMIDFVPVFCFTLTGFCWVATWRAKGRQMLRVTLFLSTLFGALAFEEAAICALHLGANWRPLMGLAAGVLLGIPLAACAVAAVVKMRAV